MWTTYRNLMWGIAWDFIVNILQKMERNVEEFVIDVNIYRRFIGGIMKYAGYVHTNILL